MFATSIVVVPDERLADNALRTAAMQNAEHRLRERFPDMSVGLAESDSYGNWEDFSERADVICFETAENASNFRYNPPFSIGRDFLPLLLFDHRSAGPYPLEKEFARQNYAYFWAIVFRDKREFETYCAHSIRKGGNAFFSASSESLPDRIAKILQSSFSGSSV